VTTIDYVLVDSSAWIASFRSDAPASLQNYLTQGLTKRSIATASIIKLELLQGANTPREYNDLKSMFDSLHALEMTQAVWNRAYWLGFTLRRNGITIPTTDIMVAALALEYDCALLHQDRHFPMIQSVVELKTVELEDL